MKCKQELKVENWVQTADLIPRGKRRVREGVTNNQGGRLFHPSGDSGVRAGVANNQGGCLFHPSGDSWVRGGVANNWGDRLFFRPTVDSSGVYSPIAANPCSRCLRLCDGRRPAAGDRVACLKVSSEESYQSVNRDKRRKGKLQYATCKI